MIQENPLAFARLRRDLRYVVHVLKRDLGFDNRALRRLAHRNMGALVAESPRGLRDVLAFMRGFIGEEEARRRLMREPGSLSTDAMHTLRVVMTFLDDYMDVEQNADYDQARADLVPYMDPAPLHWFLFAENGERILPTIERCDGWERPSSLGHDRYRTPFHWAYYDHAREFATFFASSS